MYSRVFSAKRWSSSPIFTLASSIPSSTSGIEIGVPVAILCDARNISLSEMVRTSPSLTSSRTLGSTRSRIGIPASNNLSGPLLG
ncbi:MAG: hypothetical protein F2723_02555 [Actinobacteria bacterium]|nr:hypothetical protein [Actinomycetota bacterium]